MSDSLAKAIREKMPQLELRENEPMCAHTSFKIGGPAELMLFPGSAAELRQLCELLKKLGVRPMVLGNGSNVLAPDVGINGAVIVTAGACAVRADEGGLTAECGAQLTKTAVAACEHELEGLEFAYGIPGTVGGALVMNAGAYGGEMKDVVVSTRFLDAELNEREYRGQQHMFAYRSSGFQARDVILETRLSLKKGAGAEIRARMDELMSRRKASQPLNLPSAGSAFKRPREGYAAELIDRCGLKGFAIGGACVSEKHAGFVVNKGGASAEDVKRLLEHVRRTVYSRCGIELEPEIRILD